MKPSLEKMYFFMKMPYYSMSFMRKIPEIFPCSNFILFREQAAKHLNLISFLTRNVSLLSRLLSCILI